MSAYAVVNPATGETVARYDTFTDAEVEQALTRAQGAFETWRTGALHRALGTNAGSLSPRRIEQRVLKLLRRQAARIPAASDRATRKQASS